VKICGLLLVLFASTATQAGDPFNGHSIYGEHCLQCHGDDGSGELVGVPDFRRGEGLLVSDYELAETLKQGLGTMPAYTGLLDDNELADVITYIRTLQ
jgi:mono/diheme cytochrome c family protein